MNHKKRSVQLADLRALDTLGDPRAIAVLEKFATASKTSPERAAAERAVVDLRAGRKPVDDFKNLRQEDLDLQKTNRDLRKELDELKKKFDAAFGGKPSAPGKATTSGKASDAGRASVPASPNNPSPATKLTSPKSSEGEK